MYVIREAGRFGAAVLAPDFLAPPFWHRRFGAGRFGAGIFFSLILKYKNYQIVGNFRRFIYAHFELNFVMIFHAVQKLCPK